MFGFGKPKHKEINATQLSAPLDQSEVLVVDVREVNAFADGHIRRALKMPLSTFQTSKLPKAEGKTIILSCRRGKRSGMALDKCIVAREAVDIHLAGGFGTWVSAGLPVER